MKTILKIFSFTVAVSMFYWYVGQMVPQKITYPPEDVEMSADMTTEQMVEVGAEIVGGKGTCLTCHTMGEDGSTLRFPDLGNIGAVAGTRNPNMTDVEYLGESMYDPNAFIVEGFAGGMPNVSRPPIGLTDDEILAVIAYLQSLGGTPTVTMQTELPWQGQAPAAAAPAATGGGPSGLDGPALAQTYLCTTCHSFDAPTPGAGPTLYGIGSRLNKAEIYEAIMDPDATVADGYVAGVMSTTLQAGGFYDKISTADLKILVDYIASLEE